MARNRSAKSDRGPAGRQRCGCLQAGPNTDRIRHLPLPRRQPDRKVVLMLDAQDRPGHEQRAKPQARQNALLTLRHKVGRGGHVQPLVAVASLLRHLSNSSQQVTYLLAANPSRVAWTAIGRSKESGGFTRNSRTAGLPAASATAVTMPSRWRTRSSSAKASSAENPGSLRRRTLILWRKSAARSDRKRPLKPVRSVALRATFFRLASVASAIGS